MQPQPRIAIPTKPPRIAAQQHNCPKEQTSPNENEQGIRIGNTIQAARSIHLAHKKSHLGDHLLICRYEEDAAKKLYIRRIYDMIPSQMENKKKRIVAKDILDRKGDRFSNYVEEFEYLINSGITIASHAISNPKYPLAESQQKNLLKLYMNDVGMLTSQLYHYNIQPILNDIASINLGSVYESTVAQELKAHYEKLFYYDNKQKGEVDFLVDDSGTMSVLSIEVKSGKDYTVHSALDNLMSIQDYHIVSSIVLSNEREIKTKGNILYLPIYYVMFLENKVPEEENLYFYCGLQNNSFP